MAKIYVNQGSLRVTQNTGVDISTSIARIIKYEKPDGTQGSWPGTITETTKQYYDFTGPELDQAGEWVRWSFVTFSDGRTAPGNKVYFRVYAEGK